MEPVSLTLGAVSLAGLFSLCIQCFDLIEIGRKTSVDYEIMVVKLSIEKRRLMVWGEAVGILRPDQDRDPLLDDLETRTLVERILSNVQRLFDETQNLKSKYGLEKTSSTQNSSKAIVQGSAVCSLSFESSPLVQFHTGFSEHIRKVGLVEKTRWAIRDSKKFAALIQDLKDLLDGLGEITISSRSTILKGQLIREETQSMSDLKMLTVIEQTCSDTDWRSSASSASTYFDNQNRLTPEGREDIQKWMQVCPRQEVAEGISPGQDHGQMLPDINGIAYESSQLAVSQYPPPHTRQSSPSSSSRLRLKIFDTPHEKTDTQVLVLCSTSALIAWLPKTDKTFYPIYKIPQVTTANAITASRMMKAIVVPPHFRYPSITIYCPPRMRFVHMALSILNPRADGEERSRTQFHIRFDDRLLDRTNSFSGIAKRMRGYHRDIENCISTRDSSQQRILESIDMNWLEQRIEVLEDPSYQPVLDTLEWSTIFRQSKDDTHCAGIIIMAGEDTCWKMFNTAPVVPPDTFQDGRVYRLRELDGGEPRYKWKAEHYCNVSTDLEFERRFGAG